MLHLGRNGARHRPSSWRREPAFDRQPMMKKHPLEAGVSLFPAADLPGRSATTRQPYFLLRNFLRSAICAIAAASSACAFA